MSGVTDAALFFQVWSRMPDDVYLNNPSLLPASSGKNPEFRQLPHSEEAEMALLGAIMYDNRAFDRIGDWPETSSAASDFT